MSSEPVPDAAATQQPVLPNRQSPFTQAFRDFIPSGWAPYSDVLPQPLPAAAHTPARRRKLAAMFPGERLYVPAGELKVRSNDTDYGFRPHSAFAHLSGLGADREPDAVLVLGPAGEETLYFAPRVARTDPQFYSDARYGEMWVGQRESLAEMSALTGIACGDMAELDEALAAAGPARIVADADPTLTERLNRSRADAGIDIEQAERDDRAFTVALSEFRLIKDAYEIDELRAACAATAEAFAEVARELPEAVRRGRGERWVEGVFGLHARHAGNGVGYSTIAAAGDHACTLHWVRNDGPVSEDDLILIDAGVERESLYTADVTRTLPVSGRFTPAQAKVYQAVLAAQTAGIEAAKAGARFADVHAAAIAVVAEHLAAWGLLPVSAAESLDPERGGHHRRWMVHGTSHHLGIDVHDCAQARNENYREGVLEPGMVITVEPGLYFKANDELVPPELRGIGVRIEDDILITGDGNENLSAMLPRTIADVEAWMAKLR